MGDPGGWRKPREGLSQERLWRKARKLEEKAEVSGRRKLGEGLGSPSREMWERQRND